MNWNKRDTVRTVIILCGVVLFAYVLFNFDKVSSMFSWLINILMPFVIGFAIAFVVNVPMKGLEKVLFKNKDSRLYRFRRPVCLILSFLCIIAVLTFAITMIIFIIQIFMVLNWPIRILFTFINSTCFITSSITFLCIARCRSWFIRTLLT